MVAAVCANMRNLALIGAPGSGKGTQGKRVARDTGVPFISMGDILRQKRNDSSALGKKLAEVMAGGGLVSDDIVISIIRERLQESDCGSGFVLDGFPRTVAQAEALDQLLDEIHKPLSAVLYLDVPEDIIVERIVGRRVCSKCGHEYHVKFAPPKNAGVCDACDGELVQRADDTEGTVRKRQAAFREMTVPVVEFYRRKKVLRSINGYGPMDDVYAAISAAVRAA